MITPHRKNYFVILSILSLLLISCNSDAILSIINKVDSVVAVVLRNILSDNNLLEETETPAFQITSKADEITSSGILPNEGTLIGSFEREDANNCNDSLEIVVDLKTRVYSYTLMGSCNYSDNYDVVNIALGGGGVYGDGYLEGKTTFECTRTCRPGRTCLEEWVKDEKYVWNMVGYINLPASSITICEFDPNVGNGAGWDIHTFRSFAEEYGEFYCPTWPEVFKVVLTP